MSMSVRLIVAILVAAPLGAQSWRLTEEWRIGGDADGPYAFDDARDVRLDARGNAIVLDFKAQHLRLYDRAGRHVRTVGRKGGGPGEFAKANGLVVLRDGRVVVNDPSNGRFAVFDPDLVFQRHTAKSIERYAFQWEGFVDAEGRLVDEVALPVAGFPEETGRGLRRWRPDIEIADTVPAPRCVAPLPPERLYYRFGNERGSSMIAIPFVAPRRATVPDLRAAFWTADPADSRVIRRYAAGSCTVTATVRLRGAARPVTADERARRIAPIAEAAKRFGGPGPDLSLIPRNHPAFDALHVDAQNRLWVERVSPDGRMSRFEVYDAAGRPVATVQVPRLRLSFVAPQITADRFVGFVRDDEDILYLASWRIER